VHFSEGFKRGMLLDQQQAQLSQK